MIPRHMKVRVQKYGDTWYLTKPELTGLTSTPQRDHATAHAAAFRLAQSIKKWVAA